jgi:hypothetical protein
MNAPVDRYQPGAPLPDLRDGASLLVLLADDGGPDDGAARSAVSLAKQWASAGQRIFLADLGLRTPCLHHLLGEPCGEGVADALLYGASIQRIARPTQDGFLFASAGTPVATGEGLFASSLWDAITEGFARADARLVVFVPEDEPGAQELIARAGQVVRLVAELPGDVAEAAIEIAAAEPAVEAVEPVSDAMVDEAAVVEDLRVLDAAPVVDEPPVRAAQPAPSRRLGADAVPIASLAPDSVPIESLAPDPEIVGVESVVASSAEAAPPVHEPLAEAFEPVELAAAEDGLPSFDLEGVETVGTPSLPDTPANDDLAQVEAVPDPAVGEPISFDLESWEADGPPLASFDVDMATATPSDAAPGSLAADPAEPPSFDLGAFEPELEPEAPDPSHAITRELVVAEILSPPLDEASQPPSGAAPVRDLSSFTVPQEQVTPERITREPPTRPPAPRGLAREPQVELHGNRWLRLVILLIVIGVVVAGILAYMGVLNVPGISPGGGTVASAGPETGSPPASAPVQEGLAAEVAPPSYFIALGDYPQEAVARLQAEALAERRPDILFLVAPVDQQGQVLYRLLAGVSDDPAAAELRTSLGQTLVDEDPTTWPVRSAPLAFLIGGFASVSQARVRVQELQRSGVPAYVLEDGGDQPFLVWVGAYADAGEASYVKGILDRAQITAALRARTGALPEMGLPR